MKLLFLFIVLFIISCSSIKPTLDPSLKEEMNKSIIDGFGVEQTYLIK